MKNSIRITALIIGLLFDILFWKKAPGISVPIFTVIWTGSAFFFLREKNIKKNYSIYILAVFVLIFSVMSLIRLEPFTTFLNFLMIIILLVIITLSFQSNSWINFVTFDYLKQSFHLFMSYLGFSLFPKKTQPEQIENTNKRKSSSIVFAVIRGILIAIPVVTFFAILLSEADLVFSDFLDNILDQISFHNFWDFVLQFFVLLLVGNSFVTMIIHSRKHSKEIELVGKGKPIIKPFLGSIETHIVLGSVLALFAAFVVIQFQYFFSGSVNINAAGYTYSQYARRGFGEMVAAAVFSLVLIFGMGLIRKNEGKQSNQINTVLNIGLVSAVVIMLISAFQRLSLYEQVYGFTRLRLYSHIFIIWLGILMVAVLVILLINKNRLFINLCLFTAIGFALTLNLINVDGTIVRLNIDNAVENNLIDYEYLETLSFDAVPVINNAIEDSSVPTVIRTNLVEVKNAYLLNLAEWKNENHGWQSFHLSRWRAE